MPLLAELGAVSQLYSAIVLTTACMVTRRPCMLQCCSADLCAAVSPHRLQTLNLADCSGGWTLVQGPDSRQRRGGEGAISWEPPHRTASHAHLNGARVLLNIMCNSDFRIHCLQPGDLQQHGE